MKTHLDNSQDAVVAQTLMSISGPVFAAFRSTGREGEVVVHAARGPERSRLKTDVSQKLAEAGVPDVRVVFHNPDRLAKAKSLQALVSLIKGGQIVYDPTGAVGRARALVSVSQQLRDTLGQRAKSFFYAPMQRSLVLVLRKPDRNSGQNLSVAEMSQIESRVVEAVRTCFAGLGGQAPSVRVGFSTPRELLVPVDSGSISGLFERFAEAARAYWKPAAVTALFGFGLNAPAMAQDAAVSEPNLKLRGSFGEIIDDYTWQVEGAFTAPLGERFGFAVDGAYSQQDGRDAWGAGGHLFARDPESYLLGLFAAYAEGNEFDLDVTRVGGEFELYMDNVTLSGHAGYQFSSSLGDKAIGGIDFKWYANQNLALTAGAYGDEDQLFGRGRIEWQPGFAALPGLAFNVNGVIGEDDYQSVMGGLTYYFGTPVNLKDRHRRQDPEILDLLTSVQEEQRRLEVIYGTPNN